MRCFFLRGTNVLKQPDGLHFITSGLQIYQEVICQNATLLRSV